MEQAHTKQQKRTLAPTKSIFQQAPAKVMWPRLLVVFSTLVLLVLGLVMVYSASSITAYVEQGDSLGETLKQCIFAVVGIVLACATALFLRNDMLRGGFGLAFYVVCMAGLVATALFGTESLGARRWLSLGPFSLQVSEFAKIAFVIMAARILQDYNEGILSQKQALIQAVLFIFLPLALFILKLESDLGTTVIVTCAFMCMLWFSGRSNRLLVGIVAIVVLLGVVAIVAQGYRMDRVTAVLDPWSDAEGTGYQLVHSFKALAAGGLFGVGIGNSYEKLQYLPEAETDFIFAIVGEELGLVGAFAVVCLFLVLLYGGFQVASQASSGFGGLLVSGLIIMIVAQAFINILCVIGLFPTTGKPLPFMSSGGSSLISSLLIIGIVMATSLDSHNEDEYRRRRDNLHVVSAARPGLAGQIDPGMRSARRAGSTVNGAARSQREALAAAMPRDAGRPALRVIRENPAYYEGSGTRTRRGARR